MFVKMQLRNNERKVYMLKKTIKKIWKSLPWRLRIALVRVTQPKFTVAVIGVVFNRKGEVLLLDHWLRASKSGWALPGGFISSNEQPEVALRREILEETGLMIYNERLLSVRTRRKHIEIMFRAEADGIPESNSIEIVRAKWFSITEIPDAMSPVQKDLILQALSFN